MQNAEKWKRNIGPKQMFSDEVCTFFHYYVMWKPVACQSTHFYDIFKEFQNVNYIFSLAPFEPNRIQQTKRSAKQIGMQLNNYHKIKWISPTPLDKRKISNQHNSAANMTGRYRDVPLIVIIIATKVPPPLHYMHGRASVPSEHWTATWKKPNISNIITNNMYDLIDDNDSDGSKALLKIQRNDDDSVFCASTRIHLCAMCIPLAWRAMSRVHRMLQRNNP